eukprot:1422893-Pyramimonas_sp.AAC.1
MGVVRTTGKHAAEVVVATLVAAVTDTPHGAPAGSPCSVSSSGGDCGVAAAGLVASGTSTLTLTEAEAEVVFSSVSTKGLTVARAWSSFSPSHHLPTAWPATTLSSTMAPTAAAMNQSSSVRSSLDPPGKGGAAAARRTLGRLSDDVATTRRLSDDSATTQRRAMAIRRRFSARL